ncbi:MAG: hypothetical protein H6562_23920 [Lewinellaceae bacterium]|nr:hypothetical protein [Lewinellaceae bacterium]
MKGPLLLLLTLASLTLNAQTERLFGALRARQIGPAAMSGRISTLAMDPGHPEVILVGTAGGGIWKTASGGALMRPVFDDHCMSVGKIAYDPSNPKIVWAGTGEVWVRNSVSVGDGIYKSTDAGETWTNMGLGNSERIADIIVDPKNSDVVYAAVLGHLWDGSEDRGVYKTSDGGKTWEKILYLDPDTGCTDLDIDPDNPDVLYAAMWSFRRTPWGLDSGLSGAGGLFKTTDGGRTWNRSQAGLPEEKLGRLAIGVAPSNGKVVYLTVECKSADKKGLYLSTDAGASWSKVNNEFNTTVRPFYFANLTVDPKNDSIVMKCGLQAIISEDRGSRFRMIDNSVHSDIHDILIDPFNTKHVLVGTDGGVYESFDRGLTFKMWMNLPVSQFYHVSVDDEQPYNVYGGLQDNGSWFAPSQKAGGITNSDWKSTFGGDGFYSFRHPTEKDVIFSEYQGGNLVRYSKTTGLAKSIRPYPQEGEEKFRFNWNSPVHISPTNPQRMYFGAQYLFESDDMGDTWRRISPDLTTNDKEKQKQAESGGLTLDNSGAENHCTIYTIAESYQNGEVIWVGTDDGNLQVTDDGGKTWNNVRANVPGVPENTWVTFIEPGRTDAQTAFVTFDNHRMGDQKTYVLKTTNLGKTWTSLSKDDIEGYALSIRQDPVNPDLLFLGTESGLFISIDAGKSWGHFTNNMPRVGVRDMVIHPRDHSLVMATHGRGVVILDDITPLRQITTSVLASKMHFFDTPPTVLRDPGAGGNWFGGSGNFVGSNPSSAAQIVYYMDKRHTFGKMYIEVWKDGKLLKTLPAGKSAGINLVEMPTAMERPKAPPSKNRESLAGSLFGPNLSAGKYDVKLIKGKDEYNTSFTLVNDPASPYTEEGRKIQRETTMQLYDMMEQMAWMHKTLTTLEQGIKKAAPDKGKWQQQIDGLGKAAATLKDKLVASEGDGYVAEEERLYELISDLYAQVSGYPGQPSNSQLQRAEKLAADQQAALEELNKLLDGPLVKVNERLVKTGQPPITYQNFEAFKSEESAGGTSGGNGFSTPENVPETLLRYLKAVL